MSCISNGKQYGVREGRTTGPGDFSSQAPYPNALVKQSANQLARGRLRIAGTGTLEMLRYD